MSVPRKGEEDGFSPSIEMKKRERLHWAVDRGQMVGDRRQSMEHSGQGTEDTWQRILERRQKAVGRRQRIQDKTKSQFTTKNCPKMLKVHIRPAEFRRLLLSVDTVRNPEHPGDIKNIKRNTATSWKPLSKTMSEQLSRIKVESVSRLMDFEFKFAHLSSGAFILRRGYKLSLNRTGACFGYMIMCSYFRGELRIKHCKFFPFLKNWEVPGILEK